VAEVSLLAAHHLLAEGQADDLLARNMDNLLAEGQLRGVGGEKEEEEEEEEVDGGEESIPCWIRAASATAVSAASASAVSCGIFPGHQK